MTNEERRKALAKARRKAMEFAEATDKIDMSGKLSPEKRRSYIDHAVMWAAVAEAMKVGQSMEADGVSVDEPSNDYSYTTRNEWEKA